MDNGLFLEPASVWEGGPYAQRNGLEVFREGHSGLAAAQETLLVVGSGIEAHHSIKNKVKAHLW